MEKKLKIVLFAYNFPHRKTADFIDKIYECGFQINLILAAHFITIKSPKSIFLFNKKTPLISLKEQAIKKDIPLYEVTHNSSESKSLLKKYHINFGIISGARILSKEITSSLRNGILNFHPGLLPVIRGLDSILWSIYKDHPIGATAHLINDKIDAGFLVCQNTISIEKTDNIQSLYEKNYQLQLDLISISLNLVLKKNNFTALKMGEYNHKMPYETQVDLREKLEKYLHKYSSIKA